MLAGVTTVKIPRPGTVQACSLPRHAARWRPARPARSCLSAALVGKFSEGEGKASFQQGWREGLRWLLELTGGLEMGKPSWGMDQGDC